MTSQESRGTQRQSNESDQGVDSEKLDLKEQIKKLEGQLEQKTQESNAKEILNKKLKMEYTNVEKVLKDVRQAGRVCQIDCVPCAFRWVCKNKLPGINTCCCTEMVQMITVEAASIPGCLQGERLGCGNLMLLAKHCGLVDSYTFERDDTPQVDDWKRVVESIWKRLLDTNDVYIVGRHYFDDKICQHVQHCQVYDRTLKGQWGIWFYEQTEGSNVAPRYLGEVEFIASAMKSYVFAVYPVKLEKLRALMEKYEEAKKRDPWCGQPPQLQAQNNSV